MAIKLMSVNGVNNENIAEFIVDTEDEKSQIPAEYMIQGTEAQVIEGGKRYRLDCNLQWVEIKPYSGGGGGGGPTVEVESVSVTQNGTVNAPYGKAYTPIYVNVENTYAASDEGKVVSNGALVAQAAHSTITQNGTYDTTLNNSVEIDVPLVPIVEVPAKDVNFIDYDGTVIYSYTTAEFAQLSSLPENPTHDGLISQGWNWTLSDAKTYVQKYKSLWIGQMYITTSGDTLINIELKKGRLSPYLGLGINGTVTINWGDGLTDTVTGNALDYQIRTLHNYNAEGLYTITIHVDEGEFAFHEPEPYYVLNKNTGSAKENLVYSNSIKTIRIGNNANLGRNAFYYCQSLINITIPDYIDTALAQTFSMCASLKSLTLPKGFSSYGISNFFCCYSLKNISLPKEMTGINLSSFHTCSCLVGVSISDASTSTIASYGFKDCCNLASITIPENITGISSEAFSGCGGLNEIHFKSITPPTVANPNAFTNLPTDCIIYVPQGTRDTYITATNYPAAGSYGYVEEA